jgi:hypothetical protein
MYLTAWRKDIEAGAFSGDDFEDDINSMMILQLLHCLKHRSPHEALRRYAAWQVESIQAARKRLGFEELEFGGGSHGNA